MTIAEFNKDLEEYAKLSRRTPQEVLAKQGAKLGFYLRARLGALKPEKGATRDDRLAAIKQGFGIKVREGAIEYAKKKTVATAQNIRTRKDALFVEKTKRGNVKKGGRTFWQIAVDRELAIRESGRGYLSLAGRMKWVDAALISGTEYRVLDRINREVGNAGMKVSADGATLRFDYANPGIVEGLDRTKGKQAIAQAISDARADMRVYINRKIEENKRKAGLR